MKLLGAEIAECTNPVMEYVEVKLESINSVAFVGRDEWQPITVKIKQTDEYDKIMGKQLLKQIKYFKEETNEPYKFEVNLDEWLLEGCWLQQVDYFSYKDDSYMELTVRFDNATEK